jgi:hypothetical protein
MDECYDHPAVSFKLQSPTLTLTLMLYRVDSPERLKTYLLSWSKCIENDNEFKAMYLYTFNFAKTAGQKSMDVDLALALWVLLFGSKYQHIPSFIEFVQVSRVIRPCCLLHTHTRADQKSLF